MKMNTTMTNTEKKAGELSSAESTYQAIYVPQFDIWEGDDELQLFGDLPGVSPENLDIRFENRELSIHGKVCPRQAGTQFVCGEYGVGDFHRTFRIGEAIDADRIFAEMHGGVLTLHLPKSERAKPRRIAVTSNGDGD